MNHNKDILKTTFLLDLDHMVHFNKKRGSSSTVCGVMMIKQLQRGQNRHMYIIKDETLCFGHVGNEGM